MQEEVSDVGKAICAIDEEMTVIEKQQLIIADQLYSMIRQQAKLGQRYKALKVMLGKIDNLLGKSA